MATQQSPADRTEGAVPTGPSTSATGDGTPNPDGATVYERCGGYQGFLNVANSILELHHDNPLLEPRYGYAQKSDEHLARLVAELLSSVTGGPEEYTGMDMRTAHKGMNVHEDEFCAVLDDILIALERNGVSKADRDTILALNYGLKGDIVRTP